MASTYINSPNGTGTDPQIATFSMWFKITKPEANEVYLFSGGDGGTNNSWLRIQGSGELYFRNRTDNSNDCIIQTSAKYRDVNGWYHVVLKLNSTLSTASDRATMYINGEEITSLSSSIDMTQNNLFHMFGSTQTHIGKRVNDGSTGHIGGFLASHVHFCDGYAYDASYFGSTDSTTGEWKINTSPSVTYGTRGFFILKDGNSVTDQSGNGNNFTVAGGTLTDLKDNPENVFATMNPLQHSDSGQTLSNGNLTATNSGSFSITNSSTICNNIGKYYAECKIQSIGDSDTGIIIGFINVDKESFQNIASTDYYPGDKPYGAGWYSANGSVYINQSGVLSLNSFTTGDVLQFAMDLDNGYFYFGKNGTWQNSANPTSGSTGTGGLALSSMGSSGDTFTFGSSTKNNAITNYNFGNGYFGTTAVSSAGTNASNNGIFEYDVPTGYTALSTKGLNL